MHPSKNILIISNEKWSDIWFSKHHYANELSKEHRVFFINPAESWKIGNLFKRKISLEKIKENLFVVRYSNFLPHQFLKLNNKVVSIELRKFLEKMGNPPEIFWTFDPVRLFDPGHFKVRKSIFHIVDDYLFSFRSELLLHKNVNGFVVVAETFADKYRQYNKPILYVPHGIPSEEDEQMVNRPSVPVEDYILYMGMMDGRLDYNFIIRMLQKFPNEKFLFLGDIRNVDSREFRRLFIDKEFSNLIHVPAVHALKLKYYIEKAKCCIAPMSVEWMGNMISHHKILQYMAHGKAVFSPEFSAYRSFAELLYMDNDMNKLMEKMTLFLERGEEKSIAEKRILLARQNRYDQHAAKILKFIEEI